MQKTKQKKLPVLFNFRPYRKERIGVFLIEKIPAEYIIPDGWVREEAEATIIGETDDSYVYKLKPSEHNEWVGKEIATIKYILPLGIHKSRFVKWHSAQLQLL